MVFPCCAKRVEISFPDVLPVLKLDAEFKGRLTGPHEVRFTDAEQAVEQLHRRDRAFTDPDRADGIGFDQGQVNHRTQRIGQRRSGHPPRRAAASHHHPQFCVSVHRDSPLNSLALI